MFQATLTCVIPLISWSQVYLRQSGTRASKRHSKEAIFPMEREAGGAMEERREEFWSSIYSEIELNPAEVHVSAISNQKITPKKAEWLQGAAQSRPHHGWRSPYCVRRDFDMNWFRTNEIDDENTFADYAAYDVSEQENDEDKCAYAEDPTLSSPPQQSRNLARKSSLLTSSFLNMKVVSPSDDDDDAAARCEDDGEDIPSGGGFGFSFPTTPSCNEEEEEAEDPRIEWPLQSPVQQLNFDTMDDADIAGAIPRRKEEEEIDQDYSCSFSNSSGFGMPRVTSKSSLTAATSSCSTSYQDCDLSLDLDHHTDKVSDKSSKEGGPRGLSAPRFAPASEEYVTMNLRVLQTRGKTGLEEKEDLEIVPNEVIANRYKIVGEVGGKSAFSRAVQAIDIESGASVCLKIANNDKSVFDQTLDEVRVLKTILDEARKAKDERVFGFVEMKDYFYCREHLFIVLELLKQSLYQFQQSNAKGEKYFTLARIQSIAIQIFRSLKELHKMGLVHADLKPENILLQSYSKCTIKIVDLGSAR